MPLMAAAAAAGRDAGPARAAARIPIQGDTMALMCRPRGRRFAYSKAGTSGRFIPRNTIATRSIAEASATSIINTADTSYCQAP